MRYRLRTLLIVMAVSGPLAALSWQLLWTTPPLAAYRRATQEVQSREAELAWANALDNGSRLTKAGTRHAQLRYKRSDEWARKNSLLYRYFKPAPEALEVEVHSETE